MNDVIIGLTGQTGSGKSTVAKLFSALGFAWIEADQIARQCMLPHTDCLRAVVKAFGEHILLPDGTLHRHALGDLVFSDPEQLALLNRITHPHIVATIQERITQLQQEGNTAILLDAPQLFESGANLLCDRIVAVIAPEKLRLARIIERDAITREQAITRSHAQYSEEFFKENADYCITNIGSLDELSTQVQSVIASILQSKER